MKYLIRDARAHIERTMAASNASFEAFFRTALLAIGSIRIQSKWYWTKIAIPTYEMLSLTDDWNQIDQEFSGFISMQNKRRALEYFDKNRRSLWHKMKVLSADDFHSYLVATVPGLGPVKAAFIVQMTKGELGCLDSVNMKRLGIKKSSASARVYREQFKATNETSQKMWHVWCITVAERENWSPYALSEAHSLFVERGYFNPKCLEESNE